MMNYFGVFELSIDDIQGKDETTIQNLVTAAHTRLYKLTTGSYANVPRPDGKTQAQWQKILNNAKTSLLDPQKRRAHIAELKGIRRDEFINLINTLKAASPTITREQHRGFLQQAQDDYGLTSQEAEEILQNSGLMVTEILSDVNKKDKDGYTPLHQTANMDDYGEAEILVEKSTDINAENYLDFRNQQLHDAMYGLSHKYDIIDESLENGADINAKNEYGKTPLHIAVSKNEGQRWDDAYYDPDYSDLVLYLLRKGADVNVSDSYGNTPLHIVTRGDTVNYTIALALLDKGADVNAKNADDDTPLHNSAAMPALSAGIASMLLENGADVNAKNKDDNTPLHNAAKNNAAKPAVIARIASILLENGADVNVKNKEIDTPLDIALEMDNKKLVAVLRKRGKRKPIANENNADVNTKNNTRKQREDKPRHLVLALILSSLCCGLFWGGISFVVAIPFLISIDEGAAGIVLFLGVILGGIYGFISVWRNRDKG